MGRTTRRPRPDFTRRNSSEAWYDLIDDYDLIEASFLKQYGIRLSREPDMPWTEFCSLLSGLMHDTPLGQIVAIRAEDDKDTLKHFTPEQWRIRAAWRRRSLRMDPGSYEEAIKGFESMFRAMAKGG